MIAPVPTPVPTTKGQTMTNAPAPISDQYPATARTLGTDYWTSPVPYSGDLYAYGYDGTPVVGPVSVPVPAPVVPVIGDALRGTHDGYGTVGSDQPVRVGALTVSVETVDGQTTLAAMAGAADHAVEHARAVALLEAARNRTRRSGTVTVAPLAQPLAGRADGAGIWDYVTPYVLGTRGAMAVIGMVERVAADLGLSYARDASRAYSTGAMRDDMLADASERAYRTLVDVTTRESTRPVPATGWTRSGKVVRGADGRPLDDQPVTYDHAAPVAGWLVVRERACGECAACDKRTVGLSLWIIGRCEAPTMGEDYLTPGRVFSRSLRTAVRDGMRAARTVTAAPADLITLETTPRDRDDDPSPLDAYPARARAVLVAACAAVEKNGEDYATTGGPTVALRIAVALALGETPTASGQRRAMSALRAMV